MKTHKIVHSADSAKGMLIYNINYFISVHLKTKAQPSLDLPCTALGIRLYTSRTLCSSFTLLSAKTMLKLHSGNTAHSVTLYLDRRIIIFLCVICSPRKAGWMSPSSHASTEGCAVENSLRFHSASLNKPTAESDSPFPLHVRNLSLLKINNAAEMLKREPPGGRGVGPGSPRRRPPRASSALPAGTPGAGPRFLGPRSLHECAGLPHTPSPVGIPHGPGAAWLTPQKAPCRGRAGPVARAQPAHR